MPSSEDARSVQHVAIIPDGNRRWARARGLTATDGHRAGIANATRIARDCFDAGVTHFTFWWGSPANLQKRDPSEVAGIVTALSSWLKHDAHSLFDERRVQTRVLGRWRELCPELAPWVEALPSPAIQDGSERPQVTVLMAYDGRDEIRAAADALSGGGVSEEEFGRALWTGGLPPVDLLVRTGGRGHLSAGFLLWQIAEARIRFSDTMWPALGNEELKSLLDDARQQSRRYGA